MDMKAQYMKPSTEVLQVAAYALLQGVSGAGFKDGGKATGSTIDPQ